MNPQKAKLQRQRKELEKQNAALIASSEKEDRDLTEDEEAAFNANIEQIQALRNREERLDAVLAAELTEPPIATSRDTDAGPGRVEVKPPNFIKDPKKGFQTHTEFLTGVIKSTRAGRVEDPRLRFLVSDREGKAVHQIGTDGMVIDAAGRSVNIAAGSDEQGMYADPYGGFFVPEAFSPGPMQVQPEADPIGPRVTRVPMTAPVVKINARVDKDHSTSVSGGFQLYRRAETDSASSSRAAYEQVRLEANSLYGLAYATNELLASSPVSFAAIIAAGFRSEIPNKLIDERLNGTGVGEFEGVANSGAIVTVSAETDQDADSIVYENIVKMRARAWNYQNCVWLYNHDCLPQLMTMVLEIGTGGVPMWQTSARDGEPDMLCGRPAFPTEYCKTVGDAGDIILVNWGEYLEGTYMPFETAESMHVRFVENETAFRVTMMNAGALWWRSYLTPKNSTNYLSPVVYLAART